jgi:hypothetical protein
MASRTGVLSDEHILQHCAKYRPVPLGVAHTILQQPSATTLMNGKRLKHSQPPPRPENFDTMAKAVARIHQDPNVRDQMESEYAKEVRTAVVGDPNVPLPSGAKQMITPPPEVPSEEPPGEPPMTPNKSSKAKAMMGTLVSGVASGALSVGKALTSPTAQSMGKQALRTAASVTAATAMVGLKGTQGFADAVYTVLTPGERPEEHYATRPRELGGPSEPLSIANVFRPQLTFLQRAEATDEGAGQTNLRRSTRSNAGVPPDRYGYS